MKYQLGILLHLISMSFAVGLAYIALDRFRYTNTVISILTTARHKLQKHIEERSPAQADSGLTKLGRCLKDASETGLGIKIFIFRGPRTFGTGNKAGWDIYVITIFLVLQFLSLCYASLFPEDAEKSLYWSIFISAVLGILLAAIFVSQNLVA